MPTTTDRPRRKSTKMVGRNTNCPPKKTLPKKRPIKAPTPCPPSIHGSVKVDSIATQCFKAPPNTTASKACTQKSSFESGQDSICSTVGPRPAKQAHPRDCGCTKCEKTDPCAPSRVEGRENVILSTFNFTLTFSAFESFIDDASLADSVCTMSKASEKNMSNFFYDNPSMKSSTSKKVSGCAEILDCLDDDTDIWILQCPKSFDINKVLNTDLGQRKSTIEPPLDVCSDRFKSCVNMICLAPEKAAEYQSICDQIRLIQPIGKIIVTETQPELTSQSDVTCTEDDDCSQLEDAKSLECSPLASKKIQKKLNDQRFTIETTVTVENCDDRSGGKKPRKSIKEEPSATKPCVPLCPPEITPIKRKKKAH